ncbi:MAG: OmpA family protein [Thalassobaculum sp.]
MTATYEEVAREVVYFDFDRDTITPEAQAKIDAFVMAMRELEHITLFITGHTDRAGSNEYNQNLLGAPRRHRPGRVGASGYDHRRRRRYGDRCEG